MRHLRKSRRFGRQPDHRKAMFRNMVTSLFLHERILTTLEKAKELRRVAEKLVTIGKKGNLAARRSAARYLYSQTQKQDGKRVREDKALKKLFDVLAPRFLERPGGYTRIIRTGRRRGDNAAMAFIEMLPEEKKAKAQKPVDQETASEDTNKTAKVTPKMKATKKIVAKAGKKTSQKKTTAKKKAASKTTKKTTAKKSAKKTKKTAAKKNS